MNKELSEHEGTAAMMEKTDAAIVFKDGGLELFLPKPENISFRVEQGSPAYVASVVATMFHEGNVDIWNELERRFVTYMDEIKEMRSVN